eukprot:3465917-Pyramimonas_sp.AAC.1
MLSLAAALPHLLSAIDLVAQLPLQSQSHSARCSLPLQLVDQVDLDLAVVRVVRELESAFVFVPPLLVFVAADAQY